MSTKSFGIALVILGIVMMAYSGFTYYTTENLVDLGPVKIEKEKKNSFKWPPIVGVILVISGTVMIVFDRKVRNNY